MFAVLAITGNLAAAELTHGPIVGRAGATHIGIWIRTTEPADFHVRYGTDVGKLESRSRSGQTRLAKDNS